jgi:hypothetical protein
MKKIDNLKEMQVWNDLQFLSSTIKKQLEKRETKNLKKLSSSIIRIIFYFQEYSNNIKLYKKAISEYRLAKNKAILRARNSEEKLRKINKS